MKKKLKYEKPEVADLSRSTVWQAEGTGGCTEGVSPSCTSGATYSPPKVNCTNGGTPTGGCLSGSSGVF